MLTPASDPLPVKGVPAVTSSELKPVYVVDAGSFARDLDAGDRGVMPVAGIELVRDSLWLATTSVG